MSEGGVTQVSPDSGGVGLSAATEAQGPGGARAEEWAEEWAGPQEAPVRKWVLRAPCGTVVLDPRVSPQDVARVQALLREVSAGLEPGPAETGQALPGSAPPPVGAAQAVVAAAGPRGPEPGL